MATRTRRTISSGMPASNSMPATEDMPWQYETVESNAAYAIRIRASCCLGARDAGRLYSSNNPWPSWCWSSDPAANMGVWLPRRVPRSECGKLGQTRTTPSTHLNVRGTSTRITRIARRVSSLLQEDSACRYKPGKAARASLARSSNAHAAARSFGGIPANLLRRRRRCDA